MDIDEIAGRVENGEEVWLIAINEKMFKKPLEEVINTIIHEMDAHLDKRLDGDESTSEAHHEDYHKSSGNSSEENGKYHSIYSPAYEDIPKDSKAGKNKKEIEKAAAASKDGIEITLYESVTAPNISNDPKDLNSGGSLGGRNYESFTNELGDVKYFYENVRDEASFKLWEETTGDSKGLYKKEGGAGEASFIYSEERMKDLKSYKESGKLEENNETYDKTKTTIKKNDT